MGKDEELVRSWQSLPRRIYLDTATLQTIHEYGWTIFEDEPYEPLNSGVAGYEGHEDQVRCLQRILAVNDRAHFEFVITQANLREAMAHDHGGAEYKQWVLDVLDTWLVQASGELPTQVPAAFDRSRNISRKDALLLQDAVEYRCDAFLTMEKNLPTQANFIKRITGLRVLQPTKYWELLEPWARLYH
jgi:hypothetical protein